MSEPLEALQLDTICFGVLKSALLQLCARPPGRACEEHLSSMVNYRLQVWAVSLLWGLVSSGMER